MPTLAPITKQAFYQYLKCPSWIAHAAKVNHREDDLRFRLQQDGLLQEVEREILKKRGQIVEVENSDPEEMVGKTLELMREGVKTIYAGALVHGRYIARPDMLERVEGKSKFGEYYYVTCDIKRSRHLKEEYMFQGAFYADVLEKIQGVRPVRSYIMNPKGEIQAYDIADVEVKYRLTLDSIERILDGEEEPHFLTSDCKQSPWFAKCVAHAEGCDDLSRLNRLWRSEADALRESGIRTVEELAKAGEAEINARISGITAERLHYVHLQARALVEKRAFRLSEPQLSDDRVALVIDIESDPLRDLHYLFGVLEVNGDQAVFRKFLARTPQEEKAAWEEFCAYIRGFIGTPMYHYGWYEQDVFRVMAERHGAPEVVRSMLVEQGIDLLTIIRDSVILPLSFYSLKDIAKYAGFSWRHDDASGLNSVLWYEEFLKTGDEAVLQDIVHYNEDDVLATWHVRKWLTSIR
ncbi:TM0106 family RecB-like putative nuclease [Patescibacteria group bacterium]|nr:TM0106 family RecB-like putative nuclease [Patescibacteria group bacterium]